MRLLKGFLSPSFPYQLCLPPPLLLLYPATHLSLPTSHSQPHHLPGASPFGCLRSSGQIVLDPSLGLSISF